MIAGWKNSWKKHHGNVIVYVVLLLLALVLLIQMCRNSNQAMQSIVIETEFIGEYSLGGSEWKPLSPEVKLSGFGGDLILRGQLDLLEGIYLSFYLNHIGISISVNGERVFESGRIEDDLPEMICGSYWSGWYPEEPLQEGDEIEIRLHNPHSYGNPDAYHEFLNSLYLGGGTTLQNYLKSESLPWRGIGVVILVVSVALLGMSLGYFAQRLPSASLLWSMGVMSLFMGGYLWIDTRDIMFRSSLAVINTCVRQYCLMFAFLELVNCIRKILTGKEKRFAEYLTAAVVAADGVLLVLSLTDRIAIYDTGLFWAIAQGLAALILLFLCLRECRRREKKERVLLISGMILLCAGLLELVNARTGFWISGILGKVVFILLFFFYIIRAVKMVAVNHKESVRAKKLAEELRNSRIVLAMSQIRTHFIFNVLTAISGMCEYDPAKADETLIMFSRYLRNNIDIMEEDKLETFTKSLEHLEDYIALEKLRFGKKLRFVKKIEVENFMMPPLVLQPVVENSIKYGLLPKPAGGTVELHTYREGGNVVITITDDGIGFEPENLEKEGSVGLKNVRFRLMQMADGQLEIESSPGKGTKVTMSIPYH